MMSSKSVNVWESSDSMAARTYRPPLYTGSPILTRGAGSGGPSDAMQSPPVGDGEQAPLAAARSGVAGGIVRITVTALSIGPRPGANKRAPPGDRRSRLRVIGRGPHPATY